MFFQLSCCILFIVHLKYSIQAFTIQDNVIVDSFEENPEGDDNFLNESTLSPLEEPEEMDVTNSSTIDPVRNGIKAGQYRWINAVIPYQISRTFSIEEREMLMRAFDEFQRKTCVRFRPRFFEKDYLAITGHRPGCTSSVGRLGGRQEVNFEAPKCFRKYGIVLHELMHAIGFFHEQNRSDRDQYVKVLYQNIREEMKRNFNRLKRDTATSFGVPYDYGSIMHYTLKSFSRNGKPTLQPLQLVPKDVKIGQRLGLSDGDIRKIRSMYKCR